MRFFGDLLSFEDALKDILNTIIPIGRTENQPLEGVLGRILACDVTATHNTPPFDRSNMDGYAVKAQDIAAATAVSPARLELVETVYAGGCSTQAVKPGKCVQIATGAAIPDGADAVVMAEDTRRDGTALLVTKSVSVGDNIGRLGGDIMKGETLLKTGTIMGAAQIGVLASQGLSSATVYARPVVAVLPTGEEIVPPGQPLSDGQIYDINSSTITATVRQYGGEARLLPIVGDNTEELEKALDLALTADLVLTSGGSSVGEKDLFLDILERRGRIFFRGVKIKPSKTTVFAEIAGKPVLGISGNPTSCLMAAHLFLVPALRCLARIPGPAGHSVMAKMAEKISENDRRQFVTVRIDDGWAYPVFKASSAITSMSGATGYVTVAENTTLEQGAAAEVILF